MNTKLLYLEDAEVLKFEANIVEKASLSNGQFGVFLEGTYFYPSGGGQECDHGSIGDAQVINVYKDPDDESRVIHVVDREIPIGQTAARVEPLRRRQLMQHHTAQHILSQCFLKELGLETVSVKISSDSPSTLDLETSELQKEVQERIETIANGIVFEDRFIKSYFVNQAEASKLALRRQPTVNEDIRIVEIDGYDMTPCGGTHCSTTGKIGLIKILRTEHVNSGKTRVHFAAGWKVLDIFRQNLDIIQGLSAEFNTSEVGIVKAVQKQVQQLSETHQALQAAQVKLIPLEVEELAETGKVIEGRKVVFAQFDNRPGNEVRALAEAFNNIKGIVAALLNKDGQKFSLVVCCGEDSGINARELLMHILAPLGGRGGGDVRLAQGGGVVEAEGMASLMQGIQDAMGEFLASSYDKQ